MDKITYLMMNLIHHQLRRCNVPPNHRLACSSISQHTATPELGMIPLRIRVNVGLHIAKGRKSATNIAGFIKPSTTRPSQHSPKTNHCVLQQNNPFTAP